MGMVKTSTPIRKEDWKYLKVGKIYGRYGIMFELIRKGRIAIVGKIVEMNTSVPSERAIGEIISILRKDEITMVRHISGEQDKKEMEDSSKSIRWATKEEIENSMTMWNN